MIKDLTACVKPHMLVHFLEGLIEADSEGLKAEAEALLYNIRSTINISDNPEQFVEIALSSCASAFDTTPEEIRSKKRNSNIINGKRTFMWVVKAGTGCTHKYISDYLDMHHSSVIHHLNTVDAYLAYDMEFRSRLNTIVMELKRMGYVSPTEKFIAHVNRAQRNKKNK